MFPAAYDLKEFYMTAQGWAVSQMLYQRLRAWWPQTDMTMRDTSSVLVGVGYAVPYLGRMDGPRKSFAVLSGQMGAMVWPANGGQRCVLAEHGVWPLPAASVDHILMIHELEFAEDPADVLEEAWRVLKPEGKLMLVVPNRTGFWARAEKTPFGHGRPFTATQLHDLLRDGNFALERMAGALVAPPWRNATFIRHVAPALEYMAPLCAALCGVTVAEASKRLYSPIRGKPKAVAAKPAIIWGETVPQGH